MSEFERSQEPIFLLSLGHQASRCSAMQGNQCRKYTAWQWKWYACGSWLLSRKNFLKIRCTNLSYYVNLTFNAQCFSRCYGPKGLNFPVFSICALFWRREPASSFIEHTSTPTMHLTTRPCLLDVSNDDESESHRLGSLDIRYCNHLLSDLYFTPSLPSSWWTEV